MPESNAIHEASLTLKRLLQKHVSVVEDDKIVLSDLSEKVTGNVITLFLFEVVEDPSARNRGRRRSSDGERFQLSKADQTLLLRYLVTPWGDPATSQKVLGEILQTFYERPIIAGEDLSEGLRDTGEALKVTLAPLSLEERTRVWHAISKDYRLSVTYEVRVVRISPKASEEVPMARSRDLNFGALEERV